MLTRLYVHNCQGLVNFECKPRQVQRLIGTNRAGRTVDGFPIYSSWDLALAVLTKRVRKPGASVGTAGSAGLAVAIAAEEGR